MRGPSEIWEPDAGKRHVRICEGAFLNFAWIRYWDTTKGNRWPTGNTNRILNKRENALLTRSYHSLSCPTQVKRLHRFPCVLLLFVIACVLSGVYGAIHNQLSYTVSPEYFTKFKFEQFGIAPSIPERHGAAIVGWQASRWMGIVLGVFLIPFGLLIRGTFGYFVWMLRVFGLVLMTSMSFALLALLYAYFTITPQAAGELIFNGQPISNPVGFLQAGFMHNASYLGGLLGVFVGMASILRRFLTVESRTDKILSGHPDQQTKLSD